MTRIAGWKYALFDLAKTVRAVAVMAITKVSDFGSCL